MSAGLPDEAALPDGAGVPNLLLQASTYVADLQRRLADARRDQSQMAQERDQLTERLSAAQRDQAALRAENAGLRSELKGAADAIEAHAAQLRTLERRAAERQAAADAAAASGREEAARLRAAVQQLEGRCRRQAEQLSAVPALQQQLQARMAELEQQRKDAEAAEQRLRNELGALSLERHTFREKYQRYKRTVQVQADAYSIVKEKLKRERSERRKQVCQLQASLQAALAGRPQQQQQQQGQEQGQQQGHVAAPAAHQSVAGLEHPHTQSAPSITGQDSLSDQLHLSVSCPTAARHTSMPCSGDATAQEAGAGADRGQAGVTSALAQPHPLAAPQQCRISSSGRDGRQQGAGAAATVVSPLQRRLEPPPLAEAPPAEEVWPEDEPPQPPPPAALTPSPGGADGSEGDDPVEATQAVAPLVDHAVGTHAVGMRPEGTQLSPLSDQHQLEQRQAHRAAADGPPGAGLAAAHPGPQWRHSDPVSNGLEPYPRTERAVTMHRAQQQQQRRQQWRQEPQGQGPAAERAPPPQGAELAARQPAAPPGARGTSQRLPGAGWKQAVRDKSATHSAFELHAPACGDRSRASQPGGVPVPQPRAAHGGSKQPQAGNGDAGYAYQAVIRKRAEREMLQGVECQQCHRFYSALESWGTIGQGSVRLECGHVQQAPGGAVGGPEALHRAQLMQEGSRHRYLFRPPDTQDGFWDMDVTQRPPPKRRHEEPAQAARDGQGQLQEPKREPQALWHGDDFDS